MIHELSSSLRRRVTGALLALLTAVALVGSTAALAHASGPSLEQFDTRNWTCFVPPTVPDCVVCYNAGTGRPFPGNPDPAPSYTFLAFTSSSGDFLFTGHLLRADLYAGQPCAPDGGPYVFRALIGYYECVHI